MFGNFSSPIKLDGKRRYTVQISAEVFTWIQVCALAGPLEDKAVSKSVLNFGCVFRVILRDEPLPQSKVQSAPEEVIIKVHYGFHLSLNPDYSPTSCYQKTSSQHDTTTIMAPLVGGISHWGQMVNLNFQ